MAQVYSKSPSELFFAYEAPGPAMSAWERLYIIHAHVTHKAVVVEYWQKMPGERFDAGPKFDRGGRHSFEAGLFPLNEDGSLGKARVGAVGLLDPKAVLAEVVKLQPTGWRQKPGFGPKASRVASAFVARELTSPSSVLREMGNLRAWEGSGTLRSYVLALGEGMEVTYGIVDAPDPKGFWVTARLARAGGAGGMRWFVSPDGSTSSSALSASTYEDPEAAVAAALVHAGAAIRKYGLPAPAEESMWDRWFHRSALVSQDNPDLSA